MTGVEILLILVGLVLMVGSFFVTEKLSGADLDKIAELSQAEMKHILEKELAQADGKIEEQIDTAIEDSIGKVERGLDKETNEKMMAIGEYSDTILEKMNQTHNEIMFLYSMLNDKHQELTELAGSLGQMSSDIRRDLEELRELRENLAEEPEPQTAEPETAEAEEPEPQTAESYNHNERILELYGQGMSFVDIARELGLGLGEVKLVVGLFKGEDNSEA